MTSFAFQKEKDVERWMQSFTGSVLMPGLRREMRTETRLFFDFYWQLLELGYTEEQLAEYAVAVKWGTTPPLHEDLALAKAVYGLAAHKNLQPSPRLPFYTDESHPRRIVDRFR